MTGFYILYESMWGYKKGGTPVGNLNVYLLHKEDTILANELLDFGFNIVNAIFIFLPGGFIVDIGVGLWSFFTWWYALDGYNVAAMGKPDIFKKNGPVIGFGFIAIALIAFLITLVYYYGFMYFTDVIGPLLTDCSITPNQGFPGQVFKISVEPIDDSGVSNVKAIIHTQSGMNIIELGMYDDGTHGDLNNGDGVYTCEWDSTSYSDDIYNVDINTVDNLGNEFEIQNCITFILENS